MNIFKKIKWFIQRGRRGWDDTDAWGFHTFFAELVPPMIRKMKDGAGCPSKFYDSKNTNNECQKWHDTLEEMAQGFEAVEFLDKYKYKTWSELDNGNCTLEIDYKAMDNARKKMDKGLKLFAKHYLNLWD